MLQALAIVIYMVAVITFSVAVYQWNPMKLQVAEIAFLSAIFIQLFVNGEKK